MNLGEEKNVDPRKIRDPPAKGRRRWGETGEAHGRRTRRSSRMKLRSSQKAIGQTTYLRIWPTNTEQRHRRAQARLRLVRA